MIRRALHMIHRWLGIVLCIPLTMLGLTGSILVFQHALDMPHVALATGALHSAGEIIEAARAAAPEGFVPAMYRPADTGEPASVSLAKSSHKKQGGGGQGLRMQMLIDPVSLRIISNNASDSFIRKIHDLHANLMLRDYGGRNIVGWFGVAMLVFGLSGIVLWWPKQGRWKQAFRGRRGARGFLLLRDLHGVAGIWIWPVFIAVSFSGVYLAFPQTMDEMLGKLAMLRDLKAPPEQKPVPLDDQQALSADEVTALAMRAIPDSKLIYIALPAKPDQPYRIGLSHADAYEGAPGVVVFIDPWAKRVMEIRDPNTYSSGEKFTAWQHAIHAGQGLGGVWRALIFLMGLMPLLFSFTGVSMWLMKRRAVKA